MLSTVASPFEVTCEGCEAVHARVAVRQMTETDMLGQQCTRREGQRAGRVRAHVPCSRSLSVVLLDDVLRQSTVLVERLTAAVDGAVVRAVVCLGMSSEMSGGEEGTTTACLLARVPSVVGVRQQVAVEMVCAMEGSTAAAVRAAVETSVGVCGEMAVQLAQLVVCFVAAGMVTDVRTVEGGDWRWRGRGRLLLNDGGSGEGQWR